MNIRCWRDDFGRGDRVAEVYFKHRSTRNYVILRMKVGGLGPEDAWYEVIDFVVPENDELFTKGFF